MAGPPDAVGTGATAALALDWELAGERVEGPNGSIWCARFPATTDVGNPPLLCLHGFPTNAYDWHPVLDALRAERDVVVLDVHGFGLSDKPDHRYSISGSCDDVEAVVAHLGLTDVDLLTHDMGDTVGGELLARDLDGDGDAALFGRSCADGDHDRPNIRADGREGGAEPGRLRVRRRVVTNGSIYLDMAQLTDGQQLLLGLPDAVEPLVGADGGVAFRSGVTGTFSPATVLDEAGELGIDVTVALAVRAVGLSKLPRTIRYIEDRRAQERRFTGAIEAHPSPVGLVWGDQDPVAVHAMAEAFVAERPGAPLVTLDGVGHYPMVEAPDRFAAAVVDLLDHRLADHQIAGGAP